MKCDICDQEFANSEEVKRHKEQVHPMGEEEGEQKGSLTSWRHLTKRRSLRSSEGGKAARSIDESAASTPPLTLSFYPYATLP